MILRNRLSYINAKKGPYNQNYLRPKSGLPAFKKYFINYNYKDIEKMKKILQENIKFYNKVSNIKSYYDFETMNEEAKKQIKYMNNLLAKNRFIKQPPNLNYIDIEKYKEFIESQNENKNEEINNDIIEEDIREEEKENEDIKNEGNEINEENDNINYLNENEKGNENGKNLNKKIDEKKNIITTTNNSTKEKNIVH